MLDAVAKMGGCADADDYINILASKGNLRVEPLEARMQFLATWRTPVFQKLIKRVRDLGLDEELGSAMRGVLETCLQKLPSVNPSIGFPPNDEVDAAHTRWAATLRGKLQSGSFVHTLGDSFHISPTGQVGSQKSPFGPVSSSAGYEELGQGNLKTLHNSLGRVVPSTKIILTVVQPATRVSSSGAVTSVVED